MLIFFSGRATDIPPHTQKIFPVYLISAGSVHNRIGIPCFNIIKHTISFSLLFKSICLSCKMLLILFEICTQEQSSLSNIHKPTPSTLFTHIHTGIHAECNMMKYNVNTNSIVQYASH